MKLNEYFNSEEFECQCGCGMDGVSPELIYVLTDVRQHFNKGVLITSGCRCVTHNSRVGGSELSQHLKGTAADIKVIGLSNQDIVADYLLKKYPNKYGIGRYHGRTHIDVRPEKARWDSR